VSVRRPTVGRLHSLVRRKDSAGRIPPLIAKLSVQ
jgi:hypothetical protein